MLLIVKNNTHGLLFRIPMAYRCMLQTDKALNNLMQCGKGNQVEISFFFIRHVEVYVSMTSQICNPRVI